MQLSLRSVAMALLSVIMMMVVACTANTSSRENAEAEAEAVAIYSNLEYQGTLVACFIHEAQVGYYNDHGAWAEYQSILEDEGYLDIPDVLLNHVTRIIIMPMYDYESRPETVDSYNAIIIVEEPFSDWKYVGWLDETGRFYEVLDDDIQRSCVIPELYSGSLPATRVLKVTLQNLSAN